MKNKKISAFLTAVLLASTVGQAFGAVTNFTTDQASGITATNQFINNVDDVTVQVDGSKFTAGDVVKLTKGTTTKTVTTTSGAVTVDFGALGAASGTISAYRTANTTTPSTISVARSISYNQAKSPALDPTTVSIQGNVDIADVVTVASGLTLGDTVVVYNLAGTKLVTSAATTTAKPTSVSVNIPSNTHVTTTGVQVSVKKVAALESDKVTVTNYTAPNQTAQPTVVVANNVDLVPTVTFKNLPNKAVATVYAADGTTKLGTATAKTTGSAIDVTISLKKGNLNTAGAADIKVTAKNYNENTSALETITYAATTATTAIDTTKVVNTKNAIMVAGLTEKDIINIYNVDPTGLSDADLKAALLVSKTVAKGDTYVFTTFKQSSKVTTALTTIFVTKRSYNDLATTTISLDLTK